MIFSSYVFLFLFLPLVLLTYYLAPSRLRNPVLLVFSIIFYGWTKEEYVALLLLCIVMSWIAGWCMQRRIPPGKRFWLTLGVTGNLGILGYFKYAGMLTIWANTLSSLLGGSDRAFPLIAVLLPIGISFYVFQAISYLVDVYRGDAKEARGLFSFATYIALFPQLIAGPIVRYRTVAAQLEKREHSARRFLLGSRFLAMGLFKKAILADTMALGVPLAFGNPDPSWSDAWLGVLCYAMQIYFDFSAYSDMAVGLGHYFGFDFPENFNSPYKARSITDFWRRWHISLSSWLRDYLYFPLGGNRKGKRRTYFNLMAVMALGGMWHGASVVFLIWGVWHGTLLAVERALGERHPLRRLPGPLAQVATFLLVCLAWVPFRAESTAEMWRILEAMFSPDLGAGSSLALFPQAPWCLLLAFFLIWGCRNSWALVQRWSPAALTRDVVLSWVAILVILHSQGSPFLYFQF